MKQFRVSYYEDGVKHSFIINARNRDEALQIAWSRVDADSVYVSEIL